MTKYLFVKPIFTPHECCKFLSDHSPAYLLHRKWCATKRIWRAIQIGHPHEKEKGLGVKKKAPCFQSTETFCPHKTGQGVKNIENNCGRHTWKFPQGKSDASVPAGYGCTREAAANYGSIFQLARSVSLSFLGCIYRVTHQVVPLVLLTSNHK